MLEIRQFSKLSDESQRLMPAAMAQLNLSARAYHRILELARNMVDLSGVKRSNLCIWRRHCTFGRLKLLMGYRIFDKICCMSRARMELMI